MPADYVYIIKGDPRTKKNHQKIAGSRKRCPICKKPEKQWIVQADSFGEYEAAALWQLRPKPEKPIDYPVNVKCLYFMPDRRRVDLVNLLEATDDILVRAGVLADDCVAIVAAHDGSRVLLDRQRPRVEIVIERMEE